MSCYIKQNGPWLGLMHSARLGLALCIYLSLNGGFALAQNAQSLSVSALRLFDVQKMETARGVGKALSLDTSLLTPTQKGAYVRISGYAPGAQGRLIRWLTAADPLTEMSFEIDSMTIDSSGFFCLRGLVWNVMPTTLQIDYYQTVFFVCPNTLYEISFDTFDYHVDKIVNVFFPSNQIPTLSYKIERPQEPELNRSLWRYARAYQRYINPTTYERIVVYGDKKPAEEFLKYVQSESVLGQDSAAFWRTDVEGLLSAESAEYLKQYIRYGIASVEDFSHLKSGSSLYKHYIKDRYLNYRNPAQTDFLSQYFESYFDTKTPIHRVKLKSMLLYSSLDAILDSIGVDTLLVNQEMREWVFIMAIHESLYKGGYPVSKMLKLCKEMQEKTQFQAHRQSLLDVVDLWELKNKEDRFGGALLRDEQGRYLRSEDLLDERRFLWISFVLTSHQLCPSGLSELEKLRYLWMRYPKLGASCNRVVVVCDDDFERFERYVSVQKSLETDTSEGVKYLYLNRQISWAQSLGVYTFPYFIWVNPEGKTRLNVPYPSAFGVEQLLKEMYPKAKKD